MICMLERLTIGTLVAATLVGPSSVEQNPSAPEGEGDRARRRRLGGIRDVDSRVGTNLRRARNDNRCRHAKTDERIGQVEGIDGAHGTAIVPDQKRGFATSGENNKLVVFDLETWKATKEVDTGAGRTRSLRLHLGEVWTMNHKGGRSRASMRSRSK
jgi:hypothetical protein